MQEIRRQGYNVANAQDAAEAEEKKSAKGGIQKSWHAMQPLKH